MITNKLYNKKTVSIQIKEYRDKYSQLPWEVFFTFYVHGKKTGTLEALKIGRSLYETHSDIPHRYNRGKGFGLLMYSAVSDWMTQNKSKLCSYYRDGYSESADRLWKSKTFRKKYIVRNHPNQYRWTVHPKQATSSILSFINSHTIKVP